MLRKEVTVKDIDKKYEHPLAEIVQIASQYKSEILLEYEEILTQKIGKVIASNIVNAILSSRHTLLINPVYRFRHIESDPDDNKFVDCAIHANARYIVTEDHHYNILGQVPFPKVKVIGVDQFNQILITGINP